MEHASARMESLELNLRNGRVAAAAAAAAAASAAAPGTASATPAGGQPAVEISVLDVLDRQSVGTVGDSADGVLPLVGRKRASAFRRGAGAGADDAAAAGEGKADAAAAGDAPVREQTEMINLGEVLIDWMYSRTTDRFDLDVS